jgi:hypothetical protein
MALSQINPMRVGVCNPDLTFIKNLVKNEHVDGVTNSVQPEIYSPREQFPINPNSTKVEFD